MPVYKEKSGTWRVNYRYTDWTGASKQTTKRGVATRREAVAWEEEQSIKLKASLNMTFGSFVDLYTADIKCRVRENTWQSKDHIIRTKILPYFKGRKIGDINSRDIVTWQNELFIIRDEGERGALFPELPENGPQSAQRHLQSCGEDYGLPRNPAALAGNMGKEEKKEMQFWTQDEYRKFADAIMDKPMLLYAFEMLYWTGIREGELLALTPADFDLTEGTVSINKSYQRLDGRDVITDPKTPKSKRVIWMPYFLVEEIGEFLQMLCGIEDDQQMFTVSKHFLHHEMDRGAAAAGVKQIRIHNLRHSHVSLLIHMGFSAVAIADRGDTRVSISLTVMRTYSLPCRKKWWRDLTASEKKKWRK